MRQNLSVYLRRVAAGETLRVTEHGCPVAVLSPVPQRGDALDRLIAGGLARLASTDLLALGMPPEPPYPPPIGEALQLEREERL